MTRVEFPGATRGASRVALVTCDIFPELYSDEFPLRDALHARGVAVESPRWDDETVDWSGYDLAVLRSTWDYAGRRDQFVAWAHTVPRLANPAAVVEWNTDKHYLRELAAAGVPVTPTTFVEPGETWKPRATGTWVVKPTISAGSKDTGRYALPGESDLAVQHIARLYTPDRDGALGFSHAIRKGPLLSGPDLGDKDAEYDEEISPRTPTEAELAAGALVVAALPEGLLYARVDLIPGPDDRPLLVEVELTEPSLFWTHADGSAERMADAIVARLAAAPAPG
jgi:hypothetical protein